MLQACTSTDLVGKEGSIGAVRFCKAKVRYEIEECWYDADDLSHCIGGGNASGVHEVPYSNSA